MKKKLSINHQKYKNLYYPPGGILLWIIIFLELITFGLALLAMAHSSKENPEVFHESRLLLNSTIGTINTLFLIVSGFFMATSVWYLKQSNQKKSLLFLKLTMFGGFFFLVLKSVEYAHKIEMGYTIGYNTFFTYYWMLTLFHVIHVVVGLIILLLIHKGISKNTSTTIEDVEASAAFWHMCDLIWLLLFPIIYLLF